jgi:hypothetical protein
MQYYLVERQSGGCDYTIGCGIRISQLSSETKDAAMFEAAKEIGTNWKAQSECGINQAELLEVSEVLNLADFLDHQAAQRVQRKRVKDKEDQRHRDEKEFERLRQRLGK